MEQGIIIDTDYLAIVIDDLGNLLAVLKGGDLHWLAFYDASGNIVIHEVRLLEGIQN